MGQTINFCRQPTAVPVAATNLGILAMTENRAWYECGIIWHFKRDWQRLRNYGRNSRGKAFVIGVRDAIQCPTIVTGMFPTTIYTQLYFSIQALRKALSHFFFRNLLIHKSRKLDEPYIVVMANVESDST